MNKILLTLVMIIGFLNACTKTVNTQTSPVDLAKLEQIKKALAEQSQTVNKPAPQIPTTGPGTGESSDPTRIVSIRVVPASLSILEGNSETFSVLARRGDGNELSITSEVTFKRAAADILGEPSGPEQTRYSIEGLKPGRSNLEVSYGGHSTELEVLVKPKELLAIDITPKSIVLGSPTRFRLSALYSNDTMEQISTGVVWETSTPGYLQADAQSLDSGVLTGAKVGFGSIRATYGGLSIVSRIEVKMPKITSIRIESDADTYLLGSEAQIQAIATFVSGNTFDISTSVIWSSSDSTVGTISETGEFEALFPGETYLKARYGAIEGQRSYFVTSVNFIDIRLEAGTISVPSGLKAHYKLWGKKVDNTEVEITQYGRWSSADTNIAISNAKDTPKAPGTFTGMMPGTVQISARYGTQTKTAMLDVTEAAVMSIAMTSDNPDGDCGINEPQMEVTATLSDGNSKDLTADVTYAVTPPTSGAPHTDATKKGLMVTTAEGDAKVTATFIEAKTGQTLTSELTIHAGPPRDLGIGITSPKESIPYGDVLELKVGQLLSCGVGADYSNTSSWSTDNTSTALNSVINQSSSKGLFGSGSMDNPPTTTPVNIKVSAVRNSLRSDKIIEIRPKEVKTISVVPASATIDIHQGTTVTMSARYSDTTSVDMTDISLHPGYTVQYSLIDCADTGCATINAATGAITAGSMEGTVKVYATLSTPQGFSVISTRAEIQVRSKCDNGTRVNAYCVFQGAKGASCATACSAMGGTYHPSTASLFGNAGLAADCDLAIKALGYSGGLETSNLNRGKGLGCSIYDIPALSIIRGVRESATDTTDVANDADFLRICACREP